MFMPGTKQSRAARAAVRPRAHARARARALAPLRARALSLMLAFAAPLALALPASAAPSVPSVKPPLRAVSTVLSLEDAARVRDGLDAASRGNWTEVARLERALPAGAGRDLLLWRRVSAGVPGLSFETYRTALRGLQGWPRRSVIRGYAEGVLFDRGDLSASEAISFLGEEDGPLTGEGKAALARAWAARGNPVLALSAARDAWRNERLTDSAERYLLQAFGDSFTAEDHQSRASYLLWAGRRTDARQMKARLSPAWDALVDARITLQVRGRGVDAAVQRVPAALQDDAGLLHDRAEWRRRSGNQSGATELLVRIDGADVPEAARDDLWRERNIASRQALKDRDFNAVYALSAPHGMSEGAAFADAEWLAGWTALRHLGRPGDALEHFQTLERGVSTPISLSRAQYWQGRALEAAGNQAGAMEAYRRADDYKFAFYGQLAAEKTGDTLISYADTAPPSDGQRRGFERRPIVRAMKLLAENGERLRFRTFAYHLDDQLTQPWEYELLGELARRYHYPDAGVRAAKGGLGRNIVAAEEAYPLVSYELQREPGVERALMLALARQESEMNPRAVSHAGARGLMQFMPATARREARMQGLQYRRSWLTDDPGYNMTLGGLHLDTLLDRFNGSYIMAAAAYNAGPSRPRQWVRDYGDPRNGEIDPVDWIEFIPFSETRNYVQRVLENTQVYRHRMTGRPEHIRLSEDITRGRFR